MISGKECGENQPQLESLLAAESYVLDLEIKNAQLIFHHVWNDLIKRLGKEQLRFPKEIIWLGGAPGSGKGTNTSFIMRTRGITANPIVISELLTSPEAKRTKDSGTMVDDREVMSLLLIKLLDPVYASGVVVDGFPRTKVQVECLKLLYHHMIELRNHFLHIDLSFYFKIPLFHIVLLFVSEKVSIERQLGRGRKMRLHNEKVCSSKVGKLLEERPTDRSKEAARKRYCVFKETTYEALRSLRKIFYYHFIDAEASIREVEKSILQELRYQSSLELDQSLLDRIRNIPIAKNIIKHARQKLVERLDAYSKNQPKLFDKVIQVIEQKVMPVVERHAISGLALINSEDAVFQDDLALAMLIDVLCERGYQVAIDIHKIEVPRSFDPKTYAIRCDRKSVYRIQIRFPGSQIRRGLVQLNDES